MLGEAQVALTRDRSPAEYRETIESTIGECERLSGIVDNLLFVARVDAAREPVERKRFDARAAAEKIASFYQMVAEDRHVEERHPVDQPRHPAAFQITGARPAPVDVFLVVPDVQRRPGRAAGAVEQ